MIFRKLWKKKKIVKQPKLKKEWLNLTEEEIMQGKLHSRYVTITLEAWSDGVAWCEAKLKEKNT